jgi:hypothetical protein
MRGRYSTITAILLGGIIAGIVDIGAACLINGLDPVIICHAIASGLIGRAAARAGGMQTAVLGFSLQIGMSLIIATIYNIGASLLPVLRRQWLPAGLAFGVGVFFVMEYVVVPLSAIHRVPTFTVKSFALNMIAMLVFGTIIAWFARAKPQAVVAATA